MSTEQIPSGISKLAGPLLLGHLFNWGLFGVLTVQVYIYSIDFSYRRDKKQKKMQIQKAIVWIVYLLETTQTILATHDAFNEFAKGWGNVDSLQEPQLLWFSVPVMDGIISFIVQSFFIYRIYSFGHSKSFALLLLALSLLQATSGVVQGIQTAIIGNFTKLQDKAFVSLILWLGVSALVDVLVASGMTYYLTRKWSEIKETKLIVSRIIRLTIETGTITASIAVLDLILFLAVKTDYYICPAFVLAKFYSNNMLVILNSRTRVGGGRGEDGDDGVVVFSSLSSPGTQQSEHFESRKGLKTMFSRRTSAKTPKTFGPINVQMTREFEMEDVQLSSLSVHPVQSHRSISSDSDQSISVSNIGKFLGGSQGLARPKRVKLKSES